MVAAPLELGRKLAHAATRPATAFEPPGRLTWLCPLHPRPERRDNRQG